eukprot:jgi/Ulvmu1/5791/UM025_0045.1
MRWSDALLRSGQSLRRMLPIRCGPSTWLLALIIVAQLQASWPKNLSDCSSTSSALLSNLMLSEDPTETPSKEEVFAIADCVIADSPATSYEALPSFPDILLASDAQHEALMALAVCLRVLDSAHPAKLKTHAKQHRGRLVWELRDAAAARGSPHAQGELALVQLYGMTPPPLHSKADFGGFAAPDEAAGLTNLFFSATGGDAFGRAALGHKFRRGLGVPQVCPTASMYFQPLADDIISEVSDTPRKLAPVMIQVLSNDHFAAQSVSDWDLVHFFQAVADMGSVDHARHTGTFLTQGSRSVPRDPSEGMKYLLQAADAGDKAAMAALGHMYANGRGVPQNNLTAIDWFTRAASDESGPADASALFGLGYMQLHGYGIAKDAEEAALLFAAAAKAGNNEARFHLGVMHLHGEGVKLNPEAAKAYLMEAANGEHPVAMHTLAMLYLNTTKPQCPSAIGYLQNLAFRRPCSHHVAHGRHAWARGDAHRAFWHFLAAGEGGAEIALMNAHWILAKGYIPPSEYGSKVALRIVAAVAGSDSEGAKTAVPAAHAALADAHLLGLGVPADAATAAAHYRLASVGFGSAPAVASFLFAPIQAKLSLGMLHEFGAGVPQDLNLAKRHYEAALEGAGPAWLPPHLAVGALRAHRAWRRAAAAYPLLRTLQRPVVAAARWALHHGRRLVDPVYAFHVPALPNSSFTPGNPGHDSFADAPPPSQPVGRVDALPPPRPQPAAVAPKTPPKAPTASVLPPAVQKLWARLRAQVGGVTAFVQRFVRTMLMLEGGFAPSTAIIVALLVLRVVLQFAMDALAAHGRGQRGADAANDDDDDDEDDDDDDDDDAEEGSAGGDVQTDLEELALDPSAAGDLDSPQPIAPPVATESDESPVPLQYPADPAVASAGSDVWGAPAQGGVAEAASSAAGAGSAAGYQQSVGVDETPPRPEQHDSGTDGAGEGDAVDRAVEEARLRSVAAAMARMHAQATDAPADAADVAGLSSCGGNSVAGCSTAGAAANVAPVADGAAEHSGGVFGSSAGDEVATRLPEAGGADDDGAETDGPLPDRMRGAGCLQDMDEGDDEAGAAAEPDLGSGAAGASSGRGVEEEANVWAGFGTLAIEQEGPPAGFWTGGGAHASPGRAAGSAASLDTPSTGEPSAFSQLASALRGAAAGGGLVEPSPLSHTPHGHGVDMSAAGGSAATRELPFPSFDLSYNQPPAAAGPGVQAAPGVSLDLGAGEGQGRLAAIHTQPGSTEAGSGEFEGFGSPVGDAIAPVGAFSGFPLLGGGARPAAEGADARRQDVMPRGSTQHDVHDVGQYDDAHMPPPKHDDDDLPDLDPTGDHTLQSMTLTGHQLPISSAAPVDATSRRGAQLLLAPNSSSAAAFARGDGSGAAAFARGDGSSIEVHETGRSG